jgi:sugar phosphate isomerase/epimerase
MADPQLLAACWTVGGDVTHLRNGKVNTDRVSPIPFSERVQATAAAGYVGIGLDVDDLRSVVAHHGMAEVKAILARSGLVHLELEALRNWFTDGDLRAGADKVRAELLHAAAELGVRHVKATGNPGGDDTSVERLVDEFGALCAEFAGVGTRVVLEPMPFANLSSLELAADLVRAAAQPNGGLLLDAWHVAHMDAGWAAIASLPADLVGHVELTDGHKDVAVSLIDDTANFRELCGEGDLGVPDFLRALREIGYDGIYGVEILSAKHRALPVELQAVRSYDTALAQFSQI